MAPAFEQHSTAMLNERVKVLRADRSLSECFWSQVAALHRQEIHDGFLSSLNSRFLESVYWSIADSDRAFLLLATDSTSATVLGFICGSTDTKRTMLDCLLHSGIRLLLAVLPNAFSFRTVRKMFETVRYANTSSRDRLPRAEILNFCVDRHVQGRGIGRLLFSALQSEFHSRGVERIKIVTGESQISAQRFYETTHARRVGNLEIHDNSKSVVFIYDIN